MTLIRSETRYLHSPKFVETHKRKRKQVITKITLTINNAEHIKQTLSTSKPYRHQQRLPKILKRFLELYGWQLDMEEIPALFDNYYVRAFKQLH